MIKTKTRIKICCITTENEARLAISHGANAVGLVSAMPSGPGVIPEKLITQIAAKIPPGITSVLLSSLQSSSEIINQQRRCGTSAIQICDTLTEGSYLDLRSSLPGIKLMQVIHVNNMHDVSRAVDVAKQVDALLLDSGNQNLATKELGGTGRVHNWEISAKIRELVKIPVFLAGGLNKANVQEAIQTVHPFAVDVCSGVRTQGRLDEAKLAGFVKAVSDSEINSE